MKTSMKQTSSGLLAGSVMLAAAWLLSNGCTKKEAGKTPPVSAEKTSFNEVVAHLDPGGCLYAYLGTEQWLSRLSEKVNDWRELALAMPNLEQDKRANVTKGFDVVSRLIKHSGVEFVSGIGISSIAVKPGLYQTKFMIHRYPGNGAGYLWSLLGVAPHPLNGLDCLPADTAWASFLDLDVAGMWTALTREIHEAGFPELDTALEKFKADYEQKNGRSLETMLASLAGEQGIFLTLEEGTKVPIPLPSGAKLEIPEPGLVIALRVKDDSLFRQIDQSLKQNPMVTSLEKGSVSMRTIPLPSPLPIKLRPTIAQEAGWLWLASSDDLLQRVLDVKTGKKPSLRSSEEFKKLAQGMPAEGNHFSFMSRRLSEVLLQVQKAALEVEAAKDKGQAAVMQKLLSSQRSPASYAVSSVTQEGWLVVAHGSQ